MKTRQELEIEDELAEIEEGIGENTERVIGGGRGGITRLTQA